MSRVYGTVSMGVRAPIIRQGDNLVDIVTGSIVEAMNVEGLVPRDRDVVCMTEAIVARAQGNYVGIDHIATDVRNKFGGDTVGVADMSLGDHKNMNRRKGVDVPECQNSLILVDLGGGDGSGDDFAEQAVFHNFFSFLQSDNTEYAGAEGAHNDTGDDHTQGYRQSGGSETHIQKAGCKGPRPGSGSGHRDAYEKHQRHKQSAATGSGN